MYQDLNTWFPHNGLIKAKMSQEIIRKTVRSIYYGVGLKGIQQIIALAFGIWLARILSPVEFGVITVVNLVVHYANNFTNFGLNNALIQMEEVDDTHMNTVFTIDLLTSLVLAAVTFFASDAIAMFFKNPEVGPVLRWMCLYYPITTFYHMPAVLLRRDINFRFLSIVELAEAILTSLVAIGLAMAGFSYWSILSASLSVPVLVSIVYMIKARWIPRLRIAKNMHEIYRFGMWSFLRSQVQLLVSKTDYFVIGRYLDTAQLGIYEKSFELTDRAMSGFTMPFNSIFFSTFSRLNKDIAQVRAVFLNAINLVALVSYPVLFGIIGVAPHFVFSCLGEKWQGAVLLLQILATACVFRVLLGMMASVIVAMGQYKIHTIVNAITAAVFVLGCFVAIPYGSV